MALCDLTFVQSDTFLRHCHSLHWAQKWRHFDTAAAAATKFLDFFYRYLPLPCGLQLFRPLSLPIIQWPGLLYWNAPQPDQYVSIAQWSAPPPHVCHAHYVLGQPRQGWHCKVLGVFVLSYSFVFCPSQFVWA